MTNHWKKSFFDKIPFFLLKRKIPCFSLFAMAAFCLAACSDQKNKIDHTVSHKNKNKAAIVFREKCKAAGVKIYRTVNDVDGIFLLKIRPVNINFDDQFSLDDPYGRDLGGDGYIESFLRGSYQANTIAVGSQRQDDPERLGFNFVDAVEIADNKRYRYTGGVREHEAWVGEISGPKKKILTTGFVMDRVLAPNPAPRYGVTYSDISTRSDREMWIAGSSLQVVDLKTNEILAERVGYMIDLGQGTLAGMRSPWLFAAENACPSFRRGSYSKQARQTQDFVEKVLRPKK